MVMVPFDVLIPARNEEVAIAQTAPALRQALEGLPATVTYILNATTDNSADAIRQTFGTRARIMHLETPGKAIALNRGDQASRESTRVYLDADVTVQPEMFRRLLAPLMDGTADLTAARLTVEAGPDGPVARRVNRVWADQVSRRTDVFAGCTAYGPAGLSARGPWPNVLADDDWARERIAPSRRRIVDAARAQIRLPRDLTGWLAARARWIRGQRELRSLGLAGPPTPRVQPRGSLPDLGVYYAVRLAAEPVALMQHWAGVDWGRDHSSRHPDR